MAKGKTTRTKTCRDLPLLLPRCSPQPRPGSAQALGWQNVIRMSALLSLGGASLVNNAGAVCAVSTGDNTFISAVLVNVAW